MPSTSASARPRPGSTTPTKTACKSSSAASRVYRRMSNGLPLLKPRRDQIQEMFLTAADLTGQSLDIAAMPFMPSTLCYVKLVPLTDDEFAAWQKPVPKENRTTIATFDGHSWIWPYRPAHRRRPARARFAGWSGATVGKWWFQVLGADLTCYPTRRSAPSRAKERKTSIAGNTGSIPSRSKKLFEAGVNPLTGGPRRSGPARGRVPRDDSPGGWMASYPFEEIVRQPFFARSSRVALRRPRRHADLAHELCLSRSSKARARRASRDARTLQPDGVGFLFHRGMPMILWEEPFCRAFQAIYGADAPHGRRRRPAHPRPAGRDDDRLLARSATLLDATAEKAGTQDAVHRFRFRRSAKSPTIASSGSTSVAGLAKGSVDQVGRRRTSRTTRRSCSPTWPTTAAIVEGTKVGLYPFVIAWHSGTPKQLCERVTKFYADGADGIAVWDPSIESPLSRQIAGQRVRHRVTRGPITNVIARWAKNGAPQPPSIPLTRFEDNHYSRWFPNTGY